MEAAHVVTRRAKQHRGFGFVEAQQIDHRVFNIGRRDGHGLIGNIAVAAFFGHGRDAQRVVLVAARECHDRRRHRGRKQHGAAAIRGRVKNAFKVFAEAHIEHFVGLIQHGHAQACEIERAAFEVIAQAARCADDNVRAVAERAAFA